MTHADNRKLCDKIRSALARNGLVNVKCEEGGKGIRLSGSVPTDEDRMIAFAIARTTAGTAGLTSEIEVEASGDS